MLLFINTINHKVIASLATKVQKQPQKKMLGAPKATISHIQSDNPLPLHR